MRIWDENRRLMTGLGIAILALLAAYFALVRPMARTSDGCRKELDEVLNKKLRSTRSGVYEVSDAIEFLARENAQIDKDMKELMKRIEMPFHEWTAIPPAYKNDPGAWFVLKHAEQLQELYIYCQVKEVKLPGLGFEPELGMALDSKGAQENLNRLSIVTRVVKLLADAKVMEIVNIRPGPPDKTGPEGYGEIMREYPVSITVRTRIDPLMTFLHAVRRPGEFFLVVRGLDVQGIDPYAREAGRIVGPMDEKELVATITASGMRFLSENERGSAPATRPGRTVPAGSPKKWGRPGSI